ncbi:MAG: TVP38/TMEM64 family protein [Phycisphaeraceae bacterium]
MTRRDTLTKLVRPTGVVFFAAVGQALGGVGALALAYAYADELRAGGLGIALLLVTVGVLGCGLALLPTHVLSLLSGWALGLPAGLAVALLGATLGSPIGYAVGRRLAGPGAMRLIERYPRGAAVCEAITRASPARAGLLVGLLRLSPVVPYGSTNVLAAVFAVPVRPFVIGTLIGLAPRVAVVVGLGAGLERLDGNSQTSPWVMALGVAATVAALVMMGWLARRAIRRTVAEPAAVRAEH